MQELEKILEEIAVDEGYLTDWYINSTDDSEPVWTDEHIEELAEDFILIPKSEIRKHMNNGWIPVEKFGLPHSNEHDFRFWVTIQYTNGFRHTIKAKWDCFDKCFIHQNGKKILQDVIAYKYYSAPEPYHSERSNEHDGE